MNVDNLRQLVEAMESRFGDNQETINMMDPTNCVTAMALHALNLPRGESWSDDVNTFAKYLGIETNVYSFTAVIAEIERFFKPYWPEGYTYGIFVSRSAYADDYSIPLTRETVVKKWREVLDKVIAASQLN